MQNKDLNLKLNRVQDELIQAKAGGGALAGPSVLTYHQLREKAKADEEAVAEIKRLKHLYTQGAERLGRAQQENEALTKQVASLALTKKELQVKLTGFEDQLKAARKAVRASLPYPASASNCRYDSTVCAWSS